jgi:hypothetical protein
MLYHLEYKEIVHTLTVDSFETCYVSIKNRDSIFEPYPFLIIIVDSMYHVIWIIDTHISKRII